MTKSSPKTVFFNILKTLILPVVVFALFTVLSGGKFGTTTSMMAMLQNSCQAMILAWGIMLITASGMWDLSAGGQVYLSALIVIWLVTKFELGLVEMLALLFVINMVFRVIVAFIYSRVHVKSMVVTLALTMIFEAIGKYFFGATMTIKNKECLSIAYAPWCFVILAIAAVLITFIWKRTEFAYHVRALGAGEAVARNIGLDPIKVRCEVFLVEGVFLVLTSALLIATQTTVQPPMNLSSNKLVFNALMAVFIGMALERYSNRIISVGIGSLIMTMINSGLIAVGINSAWQSTITGLFMALFIGFSTNQQRIQAYFDGRKRAEEANRKFKERGIA